MSPLSEDPYRMPERETPASRGKANGTPGDSLEGRQNGEAASGPFGHVAAGAFEATMTGEITDANGTLAKMLGFASSQELVGRSLAELLADPATLDRVCGHTREGQELTGEEMFLRTKQGDEVVVLLCTKLVGASGEVGRVGGDEFVVLLPDVDDRDAVVTVARRMVTGLEETPVELGDATQTTVRAEAGIALYPEHGSSLEELIRAADQAMYRVKESNGQPRPGETADDGPARPSSAAARDRPSSQRAQH